MSSPQRMSDTEGSEKPVRERLRNTSIAQPVETIEMNEDALKPPPKDAKTAESNGTKSAEEDKDRNRPSRKRSHEDMGETEPVDEPVTKTRHARKRSREVVEEDNKGDASPKRTTSGEHTRHTASTNGDSHRPAPTRVASTNKRPAAPAVDDHEEASSGHDFSPKSKKTKPDNADVESVQHPAPAEPEEAEATPSPSADKLMTETDQPTEEGKAKPAAIPPTSGFANASASSPFGALAGNKSPTDQKTTSAFTSSGFGSLAGKSTSGFGSLSGSAPKLSSFASSGATASNAAADSKKTKNDKPATGAFGGALGSSSPFASAGIGSPSVFSGTSGSAFASTGKSAFGSGLGGGFGGLSGSKLGSFASSGTPGTIGGSAKPTKPFGASADADEGEDGSGGEEDDATTAPEEVKFEDSEKDQRFFAQEIETGEEGEITEYTCRAKLYNFVKAEDGIKKEWKERGLGVVRLNVKYDNSEAAPKARLVMRADGSHRVTLNTPVLKEVKFGSVTGDAPVGGYVYFMGSIDGSAKLELLQMKLRAQFALELYDRIAELQTAM